MSLHERAHAVARVPAAVCKILIKLQVKGRSWCKKHFGGKNLLTVNFYEIGFVFLVLVGCVTLTPFLRHDSGPSWSQLFSQGKMSISFLIYVYLPLANKAVLVCAYFENMNELEVTN